MFHTLVEPSCEVLGVEVDGIPRRQKGARLSWWELVSRLRIRLFHLLLRRDPVVWRVVRPVLLDPLWVAVGVVPLCRLLGVLNPVQ